MSTKEAPTTEAGGEVELDSRLSTVYESALTIADLEQLVV